jgi:hypothetical protein
MNIFYLDFDIKKCAAYHCDKHVVKMILEYAQLLSTTSGGPYKPTHINHPCAKWVRESEANFLYLVDLQHYLNEEYKVRYSGKDHKSFLVVQNDLVMPELPQIGFTEPPKCVPDEYKHLDIVTAYREYYKKDKAYFCTWKTQVPEWFNNSELV